MRAVSSSSNSSSSETTTRRRRLHRAPSVRRLRLNACAEPKIFEISLWHFNQPASQPAATVVAPRTILDARGSRSSLLFSPLSPVIVHVERGLAVFPFGFRETRRDRRVIRRFSRFLTPFSLVADASPFTGLFANERDTTIEDRSTTSRSRELLSMTKMRLEPVSSRLTTMSF